MCLSVCLFVKNVNVKGQRLFFINAIFNHKSVQIASFIIFFHQGKQQPTLVLGQSLKSSYDLSKGQGQIGIPQSHNKCAFYASFYK